MNRGGRIPGMGRMPGMKPKNMKGTLMRLWKYFAYERVHLLFVFGQVIVTAVTNLLAPYLIGKGIDAIGIVDLDGLHPVLVAAGFLALSYVVNALCQLLTGISMAGISQRTVRLLRSALFDHMQKLPIAYFDTHSHGDLMSRTTNDIDNVSSTISSSMGQLMSLVVSLAGSLIMMLVISPLMTAALVVPACMILALTKFITKKTRPMFSKQQAALGAMTGQLEESVSGLLIVRAFGKEKLCVDDFRKQNDVYFKSSLSALVWSGLIMPMANVINNLSLALICILGGNLAVRGMITIGVIASFVSYSRQFIRPLNEVANIYNTLQTAVAGAERVFAVFDEAEETDDVTDAKDIEPERTKGDVVFDNVSFEYEKNKPIIKNVSFGVAAGQTVALVGETGAGKTTLVNLLARFYDLTDGSISIDGTDIRNYRRDSLRRLFGIVLQDTYLFTGTIAENIKYGNEDASDEECVKAAEKAGADAFIRRLPQGYSTMIVESGANLSSGQRQLIAIARAVLADSPILILDEATSNVDTRTELRIQSAMREMTAGRTTFIIAHRLTTIRNADIIIVLRNGEIVESGSHDELLLANGAYAAMWNMQVA